MSTYNILLKIKDKLTHKKIHIFIILHSILFGHFDKKRDKMLSIS